MPFTAWPSSRKRRFQRSSASRSRTASAKWCEPADAGPPRRGGGPRDHGDERARPARAPAEPARRRLAERAGPLDRGGRRRARPHVVEPEDAAVEVGRAGRVARHHGHVVQPGDAGGRARGARRGRRRRRAPDRRAGGDACRHGTSHLVVSQRFDRWTPRSWGRPVARRLGRPPHDPARAPGWRAAPGSGDPGARRRGDAYSGHTLPGAPHARPPRRPRPPPPTPPPPPASKSSPTRSAASSPAARSPESLRPAGVRGPASGDARRGVRAHAGGAVTAGAAYAAAPAARPAACPPAYRPAGRRPAHSPAARRPAGAPPVSSRSSPRTPRGGRAWWRMASCTASGIPCPFAVTVTPYGLPPDWKVTGSV
jgi:hypothetical protein